MTRFLASSLLLLLSGPAVPSAEPLGPERHLLELVNSERRGQGLAELAWDDELPNPAAGGS